MNFEFNKIAGAVLGTAVGVMALSIVSEIIYAPPHQEEPGYVIAVVGGEGGADGAGGAGEPAEVLPIADRLQVASVDGGITQAKKCQACHTFEEGGPAKVGPNLWGVVGGTAAHAPDFNYSGALREKAAGGLEWSFENLDHFIENPKQFVPGTAMAFAGIKNPEQRADVVAYLRTLSNDPVPLPTPVAAAPAEESAPAAEEAPAMEEAPAEPAPMEEAAPTMEEAAPAAEEPAPMEEPAPTTDAPAMEEAPAAEEAPTQQ